MSSVTYKFTNASDVTGVFQDSNSNSYTFQPGTKCKVFLDQSFVEYRTGVFLGKYWLNNEGYSTYCYVKFDDTGEEKAIPCFDIKPFYI